MPTVHQTPQDNIRLGEELTFIEEKRIVGTTQTVDATTTAVASHDLETNANDEIYLFDVTVFAHEPTTNKILVRRFQEAIKLITQAFTEGTETTLYAYTEFGTASVTIATGTYPFSYIRVDVTGEAATTINWHCELKFKRIIV